MLPSPNGVPAVPKKRPTGITRANGTGAAPVTGAPTAVNNARSCSWDSPSWLATISPNIASAFGRTPTRSVAGIESNTSGEHMNTDINELSTICPRMRQTSNAMEAPVPPAIDDKTMVYDACAAS